jgi:hypothetical protein
VPDDRDLDADPPARGVETTSVDPRSPAGPEREPHELVKKRIGMW